MRGEGGGGGEGGERDVQKKWNERRKERGRELGGR